MNLTKLFTFIILSLVILSGFVSLYHIEPVAATSGGDFAFHETGLASGTSWTVKMNGANRTSTTSLISFTSCNGLYSWTIYVPTGYSSNSTLTGSYYMDMRETIDIYVTFIPSSVNYTLTMETVGHGSVYPGNQTYPSGTIANLTAVPDKGWAFSGWSGNASGSSNTTITMNSNMTVTATFVRSSYNLTTEVYLNDTLQNSTTYTYAVGVTENITEGFLCLLPSQTLDHWDLDGATRYNSSVTVLMDQDHTFKAYIVPTVYQLDFTSTAGGNTTLTNGSYTYLYGADAEITASPNAGYSFTYWLLDNETIGSNTTLSFTMYANHTVIAVFTENTYTLTMLTRGNGTVNPGNTTYHYGTEVNIKAIAGEGWSFSGWSGDASGATNTTIVMNANKTIAATFTQTTIIATKTTDNQTYTVTINSNNTTSQTSNMTITPHQSNSSTTVEFTITGESGTMGSFNLTIPKAAIPYGRAPILYIDGVKVENQTYTEDNENYYVSYTVHFSTHQVEIAFSTEVNSVSSSSSSGSMTSTSHPSATATPTPTPIVTPKPQPTTNPTTTPTATPAQSAADLSIWIYLVIAIIAFVLFFVIAAFGYRRMKRY
jgi:hypothetical protein